ncbi:LamG-like jellyroll fold domain-containing protein [Aestuariirhabdus haliotis]|uniref:LamG-like jellyroll fold domain-containing protein n=1 Tax=Aestuariirhabdus haliotis TaxID=2918751 RepID=UPI0038737114
MSGALQSLNLQSVNEVPADGQFHHVVWQRDGAAVRLYVDGTEWALEEYSGKNQSGEWTQYVSGSGAGINTSHFQALVRSSTVYT